MDDLMRPVLLAGYFGFGNTGDEAVLRAVANGLKARMPGQPLMVTSGDPSRTRVEHGLDTIAWSDVAALSQAVAWSRAVVMAGGGVWHDVIPAAAETLLRHDHAGVTTYATIAHLAALHRRPLLVHANGVGPLASQVGRLLTASSMACASRVSLRDAASAHALSEALGDAQLPLAPKITADPTWSLSWPPLGEGRQGPRTVVVSLRQWESVGDWLPALAEALDTLVDSTDVNVRFVPLQQVAWPGLDDALPASRVRELMRHKERVTTLAQHDLTTTAQLLGEADAVLAVRLHAAVLAASQGVPTVGLAYDAKVTALFDQLERPDRCLPMTVAPRMLRDALLDALEEVPRSPAVAARASSLRLVAEQDLDELAEELSNPYPAVPSPVTTKVVNQATRQLLRDAEHQRLRAESFEAGLADSREELGAARERQAAVEADRDRARADVQDFEQRLRAAAHEREALEESLREEREAFEAALRDQQKALDMAERERVDAEARAARRDQLLTEIRGSTAWVVVERAWRARLIVAPPHSARERIAGQALSAMRQPRRLSAAVRRGTTSVALRAIGALGAFQDSYEPEHNARVVLYGDELPTWPDRQPLILDHHVQASLLAVVLNEAETAKAWLEAVRGQTCLPAEVVVVDGGSQDGTVELLRDAARDYPVPLRVVVEPRVSISRGRNLAVRTAEHDVLAVTDLGAVPHADWLARLLAPFAQTPTTEVVAGFYRATMAGQSVIDRAMWPTLDQVWPASFLPSSRSLAFRRSAWETVGGYPEWLTTTGEDTWFAVELKRYCSVWGFVPSALVDWYAPTTAREYWRKARYWARGDGESGLFASTYVRSASLLAAEAAATASVAGAAALLRSLGSSSARSAAFAGLTGAAAVTSLASRIGGRSPIRLAVESGMHLNRLRGFLEGSRHREDVLAKRAVEPKGLLIMLSGVAIDDTGGGARATQIALEALRQRWRVIFVNAFPKYETVDLGLRIAHPDLTTSTLGDLDVDSLLTQTKVLRANRPAAVMLEFPMDEFLGIAERLRPHGVQVIYDLLDEWDSSLGSDWWSQAVEDRVLMASDLLIGTAPSLVSRLQERSHKPVLHIPNAVNTRLFDPTRAHDRPADLPAASFLFGYIGALWGDWFDWDLLMRVAHENRDAAIIVIGDYHGQCPAPVPSNLHFLGLKAQRDLPAYLAHLDVTLIPWLINDVTLSVSPLKLYEYVAMRKVVVAPDLPPLQGVPHVLLSSDRRGFLHNCKTARHMVVDAAAADAFTKNNSWEARVGEILSWIQ